MSCKCRFDDSAFFSTIPFHQYVFVQRGCDASPNETVLSSLGHQNQAPPLSCRSLGRKTRLRTRRGVPFGTCYPSFWLKIKKCFQDFQILKKIYSKFFPDFYLISVLSESQKLIIENFQSLLAMHLLQAPKHNLNDVAEISSTCFKLNSLQLRALLEQYEGEDPREPPIPQELIERVVIMAEENADQLTREDGREVMLEEDPDLQLPFLLPEDGYTSDVLRGVPAGLHDFIEPLQANHLCEFIASPETSGSWTVYFLPPDETDAQHFHQSDSGSRTSSLEPARGVPQPENFILHKKNGGLGLSIVAAKGSGQTEYGIYIKSVVQGGGAFDDGRLASGDLLVAVDDTSLQGLTQDRAADVMRQTGDTVKVKIYMKSISHICFLVLSVMFFAVTS